MKKEGDKQRYCQTTISSCLSGFCLHNGTCYSNTQETDYTCTYPALYTGVRCDNLVMTYNTTLFNTDEYDNENFSKFDSKEYNHLIK